MPNYTAKSVSELTVTDLADYLRLSETTQSDEAYLTTILQACKDFVKEGSRFTLDELKGWLSEVAENNYGNSLEYGCNELIRRINEGGFERYVKDVRGGK